jgi:hypothetical protein
MTGSYTVMGSEKGKTIRMKRNPGLDIFKYGFGFCTAMRKV